MAKVMGAELRGRHFSLPDDIVIFYGVLPFGRGSSPGRSVRFSDALAKTLRPGGHADTSRDLPFAFRSNMFIGDGLFIELGIGDRRKQSIMDRVLSEGLLSPDAINNDKNEAGWGDGEIFLGFAIYTTSMAIAPPKKNVMALRLSPMNYSASLAVESCA